jgi:predicted metal-dependent hydrolase
MTSPQSTVIIDGRSVDFNLRATRSARRLRIRVGVGGVDVIRPDGVDPSDAEAFVHANGPWIIEQLDRVSRLQAARRPRRVQASAILFRGQPTPVSVEELPCARRSNRVEWRGDTLVVVTGQGSRGTPARTLERWLRKEARDAIGQRMAALAASIDVSPGRLYIMDQRTKWANCSRMSNLSFSWRLIMAPEDVVRYLVTHEMVHLAIPDHSQKFWLTVQSLCPETERARRWLVANGDRLLIDLTEALRVPSGEGVTTPPDLRNVRGVVCG